VTAVSSGKLAPLQGARAKIGVTSRLIRQFFGAVRVRLVLIVVIAGVPLTMLSATVVWQNYQLALSVTSQATERLRESAAARHVSALLGAQQMMQALAQVGELVGANPAVCNSKLASVLALQTARYTNLTVVSPDGMVICSARTISPALRARSAALLSPLIAQAHARGGFALGQVRPSLLTGVQIIPAAYPIMHGVEVYGFIYAGLRLDWFFNPTGSIIPDLPALWIVDTAGHVTQLVGQGKIGLPSADVVHRLESDPSVIDAQSMDGLPYCYASMALGDYTLVVADPASRDRQAARALLIRRAAQLGVLLLLGMAAVAIGVHVALCKPLTLLNHAVVGWRDTGNFDAVELGDPPQ
jgi:hypothetical protein